MNLNNPQQITLFLTGWIYPTDTSLNVAFRQDPEVDGPRMPSVWVPDADGQWKETIGLHGIPRRQDEDDRGRPVARVSDPRLPRADQDDRGDLLG